MRGDHSQQRIAKSIYIELTVKIAEHLNSSSVADPVQPTRRTLIVKVDHELEKANSLHKIFEVARRIKKPGLSGND